MPLAPSWSPSSRIGLIASIVMMVGAAFAATLPPGFSEKRVADGLSSPSALAIARDGRVFIAQQQGQVRLVKNDSLLAAPFLALTNIDGSQERGLLGIALDPGFDTNQYVYVYYTAAQPAPHNRLSRFKAEGDTADRSTDTVLLSLPTLPFRSGATYAWWHMGGGIEFGADGKLYMGIGDHETPQAAVELGSPFGKILRVNRDGSAPSDNPYADSLAGFSRYVYARGFRNPYSLAIQPSTGRVFANDVGNGSWESVDTVKRGGNHGWSDYEGAALTPGFTDPLHAYEHFGGEGSGCAIMGGDFFQPDTVRFAAADTGRYFFADFCDGWIRKADPRTGATQEFASGLAYPTGLKFDRSGSLYYLSRGYPTGGIQAGASSAWKITGGGDTVVHVRARRLEGSAASGRTELAFAQPGVRWLVPGGATRLRVQDLSGRLLWEARGLVAGSRVSWPEALAGRVVRVLWE